MTLRITEIYKSIQGESRYAGYPCTFIRLTGCPLRCKWCDTVYGFNGGSEMSLADILQRVQELGCNLVEITGGEPLAQKNVLEFMRTLISEGYRVLLETSGSEDISDVPSEVHIIMDLKPPGSGMVEKNRWENLEFLKPSDEIKFVCADRNDFDWALKVIEEKKPRAGVLFSPAFGLLKPQDLAEWVVQTKGALHARMQLQLHKYIWSPKAKGV